MSEDFMSVVIAVGIIALMFAWAAILDFVFPRWLSAADSRREALRERRCSRGAASHPITRDYAARVLPRATRRLAEQSQDVLHALSTRQHGRTRSAAPPISSISE
jgi:hypothetical protein